MNKRLSSAWQVTVGLIAMHGLILGEEVGKTSLISRYVNPEEELLANRAATIGLDFTSKEVDLGNDKKVQLRLWDT